MNAIATETLGRSLRRARHRALRLRLLLLALRRAAARHARRDAPIEPRAAYATSKRYGEEKLLELVDDGPLPGDPAQRHRLRLEPADALRPRRQHLRQGRAARRRASCCTAAAGCGGRWSTSATVADAMIAAYEAPAEKVRGEIFNVLHSNYQIRELAMLVAGSVQLTGRAGAARGGAGAEAHARLRVLEREALDHARVHPAPLGARGGDRHARAASTACDRAQLTDPRHYNIRWLELLSEVKPALDALRQRSSELSGADHRRRRPARPPTSRRCCGADAAASLSATPSSTSPTTAAVDARLRRGRARRRLQLRRLPQRRGLRDASRTRPGRSTSAPCARACAAARRQARPPLDQLRLRRAPRGALRRGRPARPAQSSTRSPSWPASTRRSPTAPGALVVRTAGLYGLHGSASKGGNFVHADARARARAGRS